MDGLTNELGLDDHRTAQNTRMPNRISFYLEPGPIEPEPCSLNCKYECLHNLLDPAC